MEVPRKGRDFASLYHPQRSGVVGETRPLMSPCFDFPAAFAVATLPLKTYSENKQQQPASIETHCSPEGNEGGGVCVLPFVFASGRGVCVCVC